MKKNVARYPGKRTLLDQLAAELQGLEQAQQLKRESEFQERLRDLLKQHGKSAVEVVDFLSLLDPSIRPTAA